MFETYEDGFYMVGNILHPKEECLVRLYTLSEEDGGIRGLGYGLWDGAGFLPLNDIREDTYLIPILLVNMDNNEIIE